MPLHATVQLAACHKRPAAALCCPKQCTICATPLFVNRCSYKWDSLPNAQRPEKGLLRLRSSLNAFANLRPAVVLPQLADASTLKREVSWLSCVAHARVTAA